MLVKFFHWFQGFSTSVEKDIGKTLTDAQSAKKKKRVWCLNIRYKKLVVKLNIKIIILGI